MVFASAQGTRQRIHHPQPAHSSITDVGCCFALKLPAFQHINYKARDIDFRAVLAATAELATPLKMTATHPVHLDTPSLPSAAELKYRVPLAPSLDGNTVDTAVEQAAFAENSVRYRASLMFVGDEFRDLTLAITGRGSS